MAAGPTLANPAGGTVVAGSASIVQPNPSSLTILQQSNYAVINWHSFNIGAGETTQFVQPSSSAFALNRVTGGDPSLIAGQLIANGGIGIVNAAGILFLKGSVVDVNSLVATTADISNANFMAGRFDFDLPSANPAATVVNNGHITVKDHGLAALVAPGVANSGQIEAKLGTVVMGGAETFTVDLYGDGLINFAVGAASPQASPAATTVSNYGRVSADGGTILLTADAADTIVSNLVTGGTLEAHSVGAKTGTIEVEGGAVQVGGRVSVSGDRAGETGGTVEVTGTNVTVAPVASIDASGSAGGGKVRIVSASASDPAAATTTIGPGTVLLADALKSGNGGKVAILSTGTTQFDGSIIARGGAESGNGGSVETSGAAITIGGTVDTTAARGATGTWLLDPSNIVIGTTLALTIDDAGTDIAVVATGNITVSSNLAPSGSLGLEAGNTIALDANITMASNANLFLTAAAGSITQSPGAAITMDGGTLSMAAGSGIGSALAPIATIGLGTVSATAPEGGIFLANSSSGSIVVSSQSARTFTAGTSPIVIEEFDDAGTMIDEESAGAGTNALVISTADSPITTVAFGAVSGLFTTGSISVANPAGGLTIDDAVDSSDGGSITLNAQTMAIDATVESAGSLTIEPSSAFSSIGIGNGAVGSFILNAASLGHLGTGAGGIGSGFAAITIGRADGTAAIDVNNGASGTLAFAAPLALQSGSAEGSITVATPVTVIGGLSLIAGGAAASSTLSINGAVTATGDIGLVATDGNIALSAILTGANVYMSASAGAVTETTGAIVAGSGAGDLIVAAGAVSALDTVTNSVGVLTANVTAGGFAFTNTGGFSVAPASVIPPGIGLTSAQGVTASGDLGLVALTGNLTIAQTVSGANVYLSAAAGAVTETSGAVVAGSGAGDLIVAAENGSALDTVTNSVGVLSADVTAGGFAFTNAGGFSVAAASVSLPGIGLISAQGVTASGDVGLVASTGNLTLADDVMGANVYLSAAAGAVSETTGAIFAGSGAGDLIVVAESGSALDTVTNSVRVLSANVTAGGFAFTNASGFSAATASVTPPGIGMTSIQGVTASGDVGLVASNGNLTLGDTVMGANVYLNATGAVTETTGAVVAGAGAGSLVVAAANDTVLDTATNSIGVLAAEISAGGLSFTNVNGFAIGSASLSIPATIVTGAKPVVISMSGVDVALGLDLNAKNGDITQSQPLTVGTTSLIKTEAGNGTIGLDDPENDFGGAVALDAAGNSGNASLTNGAAGGTDLAASSVGGSLTVVALAGNLTESGPITGGGTLALMTSAGTILIDNTLQSTAGNAFLEADGAGSAIVAAGGNIALADAGAISLVASAGIGGSGATQFIPLADAGGNIILSAKTMTGGVYVGVTDRQGLILGAQATPPVGFQLIANGGVSTTDENSGGDIAIANMAGSLALSKDVSSGAGSIYLEADGTGAAITAAGGDLDVSTGAASLVANAGVGAANAPVRIVGAGALTLAGATSTGGWYVSTSSSSAIGASVTVGALSTPAFFVTNAVAGVTVASSGDVAIQSLGGTEAGGAIVLASGITAAGDVFIEADGTGAPITTIGGTITLGGTSLTLVATDGVGTASAPIDVSDGPALTLAGRSVSGGWNLSVSSTAPAGSAVTIGAVTPPAFFATSPVQGVAATSSGSVAIQNGGSISLADDIDLSANATGSIFLEADGSGAQIAAAGGDINLAGGGLSLVANAGIGTATAPIRVAQSSGFVLAGTTQTGGWYLSASSTVAAGGTMTIGTLAPPAFFTTTPTAGVTVAAAGDVAIQNKGGMSGGGAIVLANDIDSAGSVFLEAGGPGAAITTSGGSVAAANAIALVANAGVGTAGVPISITADGALTLAGQTFSGGWYVRASSVLAGGPALTIGALDPPSFFATTAVVGVTVTTSGDVGIQNAGGATSGGSIVLANDIGASGNVFLEATGPGSTILSSGGSIEPSGGSLSLFATSGIGSGADPIGVSDPNSLTVAASTITGGIFLTVADAAGVTVGQSTPAPAFFANDTSSGLQGLASTAGGDVALQNSDGSVTLSSDTAATGLTTSVFLEADGSGAGIHASGGAIVMAGGTLSVVANAGVGAANAPVPVVLGGSALTVAGASQTGGWYVTVSSPGQGGIVTLGSATPPGYFASGPIAGVTIRSSGDFALQNLGEATSGGPIILANNIDLSHDSGGNVFIEADGPGATIGSGGGTLLLDGSQVALSADAGIGTAISPITAVDGGPLTVAAETQSGGVFLTVSSPTTAGAAVKVGTVAPPSFFTTSPVTGISSPGSGDVSIVNAGGSAGGGTIEIADPITLNAATGALTLTATGDIAQTGGTITADKLTVTAAGAVNLPADNTIANLGRVALTNSGDFVLQDTGMLSLLSDITVESGAIAIATTSMLTVPVDITLEASGNVALGSAGFDEIGMITIMNAPTLMIDTSGLTAAELDAISVQDSNGVGSIPLGPGTGTNPVITFAGSLNANGTALLFSVTNSLITGEVEVSQLGITGFDDSINLIGSINGDSTPYAALLAVRAQGPDNADRFNTCVIGSPSCVVQTVLTPVLPPSLDNVDILALPPPLDPLDIDRLDTGNDDDL